MPVRKIPKSYTTITGLFPSRKVKRMIEYEGSLERDLLVWAESDESVELFEEQPVAIKYEDLNGKMHTYTPDLKIIFHCDASLTNGISRWLCEVKPRRWVVRNWKELKPKLKAGIRFANKHGMQFQLLTEKQIRTDYLWNATFLMQYTRIVADNEKCSVLLDIVSKLHQAEPLIVLTHISDDRWKQAEFIPMLWHLIVNKRIGADLTKKLNMRSRIWAKVC